MPVETRIRTIFRPVSLRRPLGYGQPVVSSHLEHAHDSSESDSHPGEIHDAEIFDADLSPMPLNETTVEDAFPELPLAPAKPPLVGVVTPSLSTPDVRFPAEEKDGAGPDPFEVSDIDASAAKPVDTSVPSPIYAGYAKIMGWLKSPRAGMTARFQLGDVGETERNPFEGMKCAVSAGHRLRLVVSQLSDDGERVGLYDGESMLNRWGHDNVSGMTVGLRFDDGPDGVKEHPFDGMEVGKEGETVFLACWAIADDETIQEPRQARKASQPFDTMPPVKQSQLRCKRTPEFRQWCQEEAAGRLDEEARASLPSFEDDPIAFSEAVVRSWCDVRSRSEFSPDTAVAFRARQRWQAMLRRFEGWKLERGRIHR